MTTVYESKPAEIVIQRSRFIGQAFYFPSDHGLADRLEAMAMQFPKATHYTWAYRIDPGQKRASDAGEPQGTAGAPMLHVLEHEGWESTLVVVIRYFGGIKLGRGGLVHAYQETARLALQHVTPAKLVWARPVSLVLDYAEYARRESLLRTSLQDMTVTFGSQVTVNGWVSADDGSENAWHALPFKTVGDPMPRRFPIA